MNVADVLVSASIRLDTAGLADPRREADSLLALALGQKKTFLIAHPEYELTADESSRFEEFVARRENREPFQYIARRQEFYGLEFEVTPDVLIPRPETEILVEAAIKELQKLDTPTFCEIGIGSGCISISILHNVQNAQAIAIDISEDALAVARRNAERHGVGHQLDLKDGDLFSSVHGTFDMIVSNPPYIPDHDRDNLQAEVVTYEPHLALFGGDRGLDVITRILQNSGEHLVPDGLILIEVGIHQASMLTSVIDRNVWRNVDFIPDLQGVERILTARKI
jgi:release factor glutamine methyltransferase